MITTTAAGRTWHFDRSLGRPTNEHNGNTGGYRYPVDLAVAPDNILYVLSRGSGAETALGEVDNGRVGKTTFDEHHIGDFARHDFQWPVGIAYSVVLDQVFVSDEHTNLIHVYATDKMLPFPEFDPNGEWITRWGESGAAPGQLGGPAGIGFDTENNLWIVEGKNNRVSKFTSDGRHIMSFGESGTGEGQFNRPWGICFDRHGFVYVADWGNNRVQKFSQAGEYVASFGSPVMDGGELNHPAGVAVDSEGDVYVTDWGNKRVQIYEPTGEIITAFYGDATTLSRAGEYIIRRDPGTIKAYRQVKDYTNMGRFQRPTGIAVDSEDRILITDMCGRLQVYSKDKAYVAPEIKLELQ